MQAPSIHSRVLMTSSIIFPYIPIPVDSQSYGIGTGIESLSTSFLHVDVTLFPTLLKILAYFDLHLESHWAALQLNRQTQSEHLFK